MTAAIPYKKRITEGKIMHIALDALALHENLTLELAQHLAFAKQ